MLGSKVTHAETGPGIYSLNLILFSIIIMITDLKDTVRDKRSFELEAKLDRIEAINALILLIMYTYTCRIYKYICIWTCPSHFYSF